MKKSSNLPIYQYGELSSFLRDLRDEIFKSQQETAKYFHLDRSMISRYEWDKSTPPVGYLVSLVSLLAERRGNSSEDQEKLLQEVNKAIVNRPFLKNRFSSWVALVEVAEIYKTKQKAKQKARHLVKPLVNQKIDDSWQIQILKLGLPSEVNLIGSQTNQEHLLKCLTKSDPPWIISIQGLGGLGKTALANALIHNSVLAKHFHNLAWVSAKQETFLPGIGRESISQAALSAEDLIDNLFEQLVSHVPPTTPPTQKKVILLKHLKENPCLIVIDNLETVVDYQNLWPDLLKLVNPSKVILTSRHSLQAYGDVFCLGLTELNRVNTIHLIRYEAKVKNFATLEEAPEAQLEAIYKVVGGNPLALKLVIGQLSMLPLAQVLANLKQAEGKEIGELYDYIYWQAWHLLDNLAQQVLLMMPLHQGGGLTHLCHLLNLEVGVVMPAIKQLVALSLLEVNRQSLETARYHIHRLTETFLLTKAITWQA